MTKLIRATATASNYHNWLNTYAITKAELKEDFEGDEALWLEHIKEFPDDYLVDQQDEGYGGTIQLDGDPYIE